ncbi:MAG: signal peptide peptidase SppA [Alphaproteobacteria bacterium]|nr:signal peptide peptidase SppA [Alphaproteobacteria bacterium]
MTLSLPLLLLPLAAAQQERLDAPAASVSLEDGPAAAWTNPANLGYDPDAGLGVWFEQEFVDTDTTSFAVSTSAGGTSAGLLFRRGSDNTSWWGFNSAVSIRLPKQFRLGANLIWNLPHGSGNNFVSWDLGLGYRPLPYLGFGATARNIGNPAPDFGIYSSYAIGATVRPLQERLEIAVDYEITDPSAGGSFADLQTLSAIVRARPLTGLALRAQASASPDFSRFDVGGGVEVYFGSLGVGAFVADSGQKGQAYLITGPWEDRLLGQGRRVPLIRIDQSYPYQPQSTLLQPAGESYLRLLNRLRHAESDPSVKGLVLSVRATPFSFAQIQELREAIRRIREAGKPVVAYLDGAPGNGAYLLAADCDKVYLNPAGELDLIGLSSELFYLRGALDLVGVEPQYAKRAEYKSAPEQFTNTEPSPTSREQTEAWMDDLFEVLVKGISQGRNLPEEQVRTLIDGGPYTGGEAVALGLVDGLVYPEDFEEELEGILPRGFELDDDYYATPDTPGWKPSRQIALIYVDGPITGGESQPPSLLGGGNVGSATVVRALRQAADDNAVKAVVLRVDSPGGSAFASDQIWRAVEEVKAEGKPVIVSFGGVAASGGYYVAAGGDVIFAEPSTITGSIGVYGGKFSAAGLMDTLGVNAEVFTRGRNAGMFALSRPMDPVEYAALDRMIGDTYRQFKERVADGRGMTMDQVEEVARGRVWSGQDAKEIGLVDELGGIQDAIERAKKDAGIPDRVEVQLMTFTGREGTFGEEVTETVRVHLAPELPPGVVRFSPYLNLADEHIFALMPWYMEVK